MYEKNSLTNINCYFFLVKFLIFIVFILHPIQFDYIPVDLIKEITSNYAIPVELMSDLFQILTKAFFTKLLARS